MATQKEIDNASKLTALTYMVAGCLGYSIENLLKYLDVVNLRLSGQEKMLLNRLKTQLSQVQTNLTTLEGLAFKVMATDEDGKLAYEDATHIYWAAFLALLDRGGTDNLCDLRLMALVDKISIYKSLLNLPGMKLSYQMAFAQVTKAISKGEFSKEDFKNLLEVYEDGTEKLKVKFEGKLIEIDIQKELSINENIINSQLRESPSSYYILCSLRDKYIKERDLLAREKDEAYSNAWVYYKDANERWNNEYVSHKANLNKKYSSIYERYLKAVEKANKFIAICKAYESRENILRTINANLRKG